MNEARILVLGVGNILLKDEGVGVRVVHHLLARYRFSSNVELMDGGTLGLRLLDPVSRADRLIVVDAVQNGHPSGTLYRLPVEELEKRLTFKNSLHQLDLVETLAFCDLLGHRPQAVIIGIEPADISPWGTELTDAVQARFIEMCTMVLDEIKEAGGSCSLREDSAPVKGTLVYLGNFDIFTGKISEGAVPERAMPCFPCGGNPGRRYGAENGMPGRDIAAAGFLFEEHT